MDSQQINNRKKVNDEINFEIKKHLNQFSLYGSFSNNMFHLDTKNWISFSDIDIVSTNIKNSSEASELIKKNLHKKFALYFNVSIRNQQIHNRTLNWVDSHLIAQFEYFYKILFNDSPDHCVYQLSKFILRVVGFPYYFDCPLTKKNYISNGINENLYSIVSKIKLGLMSSDSVSFQDLYSKIYNSRNEFKYDINDFLDTVDQNPNQTKIIDLMKSFIEKFPNDQLKLDASRKLSTCQEYLY